MGRKWIYVRVYMYAWLFEFGDVVVVTQLCNTSWEQEKMGRYRHPTCYVSEGYVSSCISRCHFASFLPHFVIIFWLFMFSGYVCIMQCNLAHSDPWCVKRYMCRETIIDSWGSLYLCDLCLFFAWLLYGITSLWSNLFLVKYHLCSGREHIYVSVLKLQGHSQTQYQ